MPPFIRHPTHRYEDPLARVWIHCAEQVGFRIVRTPDAYASSDGRGTLLIATEEQFDPDDNLGQMILHELCHALVEGDAGENKPDWGLDNTRMGHPWREHACLRLQAWLTDRVGLRDFFAPTTDFRVTFWNTLPADPFQASPETGGRRERSCVAGRIAAWRSCQTRWHSPLQAALQASAHIAAAVASVPRTGESSSTESLPSLWNCAAQPPAQHPGRHAPVAEYWPDQSCANCAWSFRSRKRLRCRHAPNLALPETSPACTRHEPAGALDCQTCGACCREAYDAVEVSPRDPMMRKHPELVVDCGTHRKLLRSQQRCAALSGGHTARESYSCTIYDDRPKTCRAFTRGEAHCLEARRRVGLSL